MMIVKDAIYFIAAGVSILCFWCIGAAVSVLDSVMAMLSSESFKADQGFSRVLQKTRLCLERQMD